MSLLFRHRTPFLWTPTTHLAHFVVNSVIFKHYLINALTILFPTIIISEFEAYDHIVSNRHWHWLHAQHRFH